MYDGLSAPTVATSSVLTVLTVAAHEGRTAAVVDIGGAFLNADMNTGVPVHMRLDRTMTGMIVDLAPEYQRYVDKQGCIVVLLDKALYGCVESAALWYDNLHATLNGLGYTKNECDTCVFNKTGPGGPSMYSRGTCRRLIYYEYQQRYD
jgi:Reverse transcriptase (RNA-dependent DNA polymerase)